MDVCRAAILTGVREVTRQGERFRRVARRLCGPRVMEHLIDPAVAATMN
jgi:predicted ATP-dependent serine protease